jgi:hypothetical protein
MRDAAAVPAFIRWLSPLTALLLGINVFAIWVGIPDAATLPSAFLLALWLAGASLGLGRLARGSAEQARVGVEGGLATEVRVQDVR